MLADISKLAKDFESDANDLKDSKFVKYLIKEKVDNNYASKFDLIQ